MEYTYFLTSILKYVIIESKRGSELESTVQATKLGVNFKGQNYLSSPKFPKYLWVVADC